MSSSSRNNNTDGSNISIVTDSPSCNTRAASSAGRPKKKNASLPKTKNEVKTVHKPCAIPRQQQIIAEQDTPIQLCIALVLTKKNGKQNIAIISTSMGYLLLTLMVDECLVSSGIIIFIHFRGSAIRRVLNCKNEPLARNVCQNSWNWA
jgi:hypothetical protein